MPRHRSNYDEPLDDFDEDNIVNPEEDEEWLSEELAPLRPTISAPDLLVKLIHDASAPSFGELYALSDLTRQDAETLRQQWVASAPHQEVWGKLETFVTKREYDFLLFDVI